MEKVDIELGVEGVTWKSAKQVCSQHHVHSNNATSKFIQTHNLDKVLGSQYTIVILFIPNVTVFTTDYKRLLVSLSKAKVGLVIIADLQKFGAKGHTRLLMATTIEEVGLTYVPEGGNFVKWAKDISEEFHDRHDRFLPDDKAKEIIDAYEQGTGSIDEHLDSQAQARSVASTDTPGIPLTIQTDIAVCVELPQGTDEAGIYSHSKMFECHDSEAIPPFHVCSWGKSRWWIAGLDKN